MYEMLMGKWAWLVGVAILMCVTWSMGVIMYEMLMGKWVWLVGVAILMCATIGPWGLSCTRCSWVSGRG